MHSNFVVPCTPALPPDQVKAVLDRAEAKHISVKSLTASLNRVMVKGKQKKLANLIAWDKLFNVNGFFYLGFLSRTFTIHRTAGERGGYFFNYTLPLLLTFRHLGISRAIIAERSPLRKASSQTWTWNLRFPSESR